MTGKWKPRAPKFWMKDESSYAKFVAACKKAKGRNIVAEILDPLRIMPDLPDDVRAAARGFQIRPWYSAAELARLWPLICIGIGGKQSGMKPSPASLHKRLVQCGLPRLQKWDGSTTFLHHGKPIEFFICADVWAIASQRFTQTDLDRIMSQ